MIKYKEKGVKMMALTPFFSLYTVKSYRLYYAWKILAR